MTDEFYCCGCGAESPEYKVVEYVRQCQECKGGYVLSVAEMIDVIKDLQLKGLLDNKFISDRTDEEYAEAELYLDEDEALISLAERDAYRDWLTDLYEDYQ